MKKTSWSQSWPRLLFWSHVLSVVGFYLLLWWRTKPGDNDFVQKLRPHTEAVPAERPLVSIIVPARNEERNIRRCVDSLLMQDYEHFEVIVVDDGSTDQTARILDEMVAMHPRGERLWVLRLRNLPQGWAGKPHAIHRGTQEAHGEWLVFTDADTRHAPNALRSALTQAECEHADLFSLGSKQELPTFWEKVLMPMAFLGVGMLYPPRLVNDPHSPVAVANGQYILLRRAVYDALGGYARPELRNTLLDDRDLAHVVKEHGYKLRFVEGRGLVSVRMYHNFNEIWRGWRKNVYLGNRGGLGFFLVQIIGLPMVTVIPLLMPWLARLTRGRHTGRIGRKEAAFGTGLEVTSVLAYRSWVDKQLQVPWYYVFSQPLAGTIFAAILSQSSWRILTKRGVDWRGRAYHNQRDQTEIN
jgi:chlorobactene glucosyltransferase